MKPYHIAIECQMTENMVRNTLGVMKDDEGRVKVSRIRVEYSLDNWKRGFTIQLVLYR